MVVFASSCRSEAPASARLAVRSSTLTSHLHLARVVLPEQTTENPIARVSGIDLRDDETLAIGDVSEGNVKIFDSEGRLLRVLGRKGDGPGEFRAPRHPRWAPDGRLHVADVQLRRLQVFGTNGALERTVSLAELGRVNEFEILGMDRYLFTVIRPSSEDVLYVTDTNGVVLRSFLEIRSILPEGATANPIWETVRGFLLSRQGDTAYVVSTLSDSLWTIHLTDGAISRAKLDIPGYIRPFVPSGEDAIGPGPQGIQQWLSTYHMPAALSASDQSLYVSVVQGILNYGDPQILLTRDSTGAWWAITDSPPIIAAGSQRIISLEDPQGDSVKFGLYAERE